MTMCLNSQSLKKIVCVYIYMSKHTYIFCRNYDTFINFVKTTIIFINLLRTLKLLQNSSPLLFYKTNKTALSVAVLFWSPLLCSLCGTLLSSSFLFATILDFNTRKEVAFHTTVLGTLKIRFFFSWRTLYFS